MTPITQFSGDFERAIRERGATYFREKRVHIDSSSAERIEATVRGSFRYQVELVRNEGDIQVSCTCPYFGVDLCKHIWAALLAAATQPLLQGLSRNAGLRLSPRDDFDPLALPAQHAGFVKPASLHVIDATGTVNKTSLQRLPAICQAGHCRLRLRPGDTESQWLAIAWDDGEPWQLRLQVRRFKESDRYELAGILCRGAERMDLTAPVMLAASGVLFTRDKAARFEHNGAFNWVQLVRAHSPLLIPVGQREEFLAALLRQPVLPPLDLPEDWQVKGEGRVYRSAEDFHLQVRSGIDWFELHGAVKFGDTVAHLPELLAALRRGEMAVKLSDGTYGQLPQEWLKKYGVLASLGAATEDHLRFSRSQVGLLDALLAAQPEVKCDALFEQARDRLRHFAGVEATEPPAGFVGELRPYQKEGLGWFGFLRQFGFGGCLADDMGLGKTVQVLALLEARRELRRRRNSPVGPSLIVMPKSLIFNWRQEAARFTPRLRLLDHTGSARLKGHKHFKDYDVVLTTYGTLRNDAVDFKAMRFDYLILDEAQAIKNAGSVSAKAARLLQGDHRLALSGTPIENHLGEALELV